jgi:FkbM family methyltransferase
VKRSGLGPLTSATGSRRLTATFSLERAIRHEGATFDSAQPLSVGTPAAAWSYAVSIPAEWPRGVDWPYHDDGVITVHLSSVRGRISLLAVDVSGLTVIDEVFVDTTDDAIDVDLVSAPLAACHQVVLRNGQNGDVPSHAVISGLECLDAGPSHESDDLPAPPDLALAPVTDWPSYYGSRGTTLDERLRSARYALLDRVKRMPWLEGLQVHIHPNDDLCRALYLSGTYEPSTLLALKRVLPPGAVFVDAGANAGLFALMASRWVGPAGKVYAIEPSDREYKRLVDHLALNRLSNVIPARLALGDRSASASLRVAPFPNAGHNTLGSFAYADVPTAHFETVETITLDRFAEAHQLSRLDAIKMDIEGSELSALAGATAVLRRFRPVLCVEVSAGALAGTGATPQQLVDLITAAGYRLCRIGQASELIPLSADEAPPDGNLIALPLSGSGEQ